MRHLRHLRCGSKSATSQKRVKSETRDRRRARVGTVGLPAVAPRPMPLLKWLRSELGLHARTAHGRAVHPDARPPCCSAGAWRTTTLVGCRPAVRTKFLLHLTGLHVGGTQWCALSAAAVQASAWHAQGGTGNTLQVHRGRASGRRRRDSRTVSCRPSPTGAPVTSPMKGVSGTMGWLGGGPG